MSNQWGTAEIATLHGPGEEFSGGDGQELKDGQYGVAAGDDTDLAIIYGSKAEMCHLGRRMVAEFANEPAGPAVTFDPEAFRVWLDATEAPDQVGATTNRENSPYLSAGYQRLDGEAGWVVETTLEALHSTRRRPHPAVGEVWKYGEGVGNVRVWATQGTEGGPDGGLTGEVPVDGVALSLGRLTDRDLVPQEYDILPGYEAAEHALTALAERVNEVVSRYRPMHRPAWVLGQLTADDIECALRTLAQYHRGNLEHSERQLEVAELVDRLFEAVDNPDDGDDD